MNEQRLQVSTSNDAVMRAEGESSWLDRSVISLVRINWETVAWTIIFVVAAVARFYHLGDRAMSHDESLHSLYGYYLYDNGNYEHNPMMHGPFRYHVTALAYFLFGDSDTTARLFPALMGMGVIWMIYQYRRYIGQVGALAAGVMATISPSLLFHSRYIRDDIFISFFTMVWVYGAMRFLDVQNRNRYRWLMVMVVSMGLAFATMENSFIHGAILGAFFGSLALWQTIKERYFIAVSPALLGGGVGFWLFENELNRIKPIMRRNLRQRFIGLHLITLPTRGWHFQPVANHQRLINPKGGRHRARQILSINTHFQRNHQ